MLWHWSIIIALIPSYRMQLLGVAEKIFLEGPWQQLSFCPATCRTNPRDVCGCCTRGVYVLRYWYAVASDHVYDPANCIKCVSFMTKCISLTTHVILKFCKCETTDAWNFYYYRMLKTVGFERSWWNCRHSFYRVRTAFNNRHTIFIQRLTDSVYTNWSK